jgi:general secretion pathway protein F
MSSFDYRARQPDGNETTGRIEAATSDEARRLLMAKGLTVRDLSLVVESPTSGTKRPLSRSESEQFAGHLAEFGGNGLPLEAGLRAAAAEIENSRVAAALNQLANELGKGTKLETAITRPECQLPRHVAGLIAVAARTGRLGAALSELLDHQYEVRSLRQDVIRGFGYPLFVVSVAAAVGLVIMFGLMGPFEQMFMEFALELPFMTKLLFWWRDVGLWIVLTMLLCAVVAAIIIRQVIGAAAWLRWIATMPIVGRISYWSGLAEWTGLMGVLVHQEVPLPEALRLSAAGVRNAYVGNIVASLATSTEGGKNFSDALTENRQVPASVVPVIRWGERMGSLPEALSTTRELLQRRVRIRALMLRAVIPPMLFVLIVCQVAAMVIALFLPLVNLIQGLS